ncbi:O-acetyl-ADP-ribose deacetylase [Afifella pfennigii]|uniref:O-acetyl-ADP-ribose deacetylase n=1 Tax=Afifella pfennigii TaxID=209897 RepID=UPI000478F911|nr:O-acetyl-ADP-ribose deacetylase [Afifella pfennigii]
MDSLTIGETELAVLVADITTLKVAAIVNAANEALLGGGGVDGAIHRAAGPELLEECRKLGGCPTGEARLTRGYKLPADFVIHAVGPRWRGGQAGEAELLASAYRNSLAIAREAGLTSLAFPAISTGIYGFPAAEGAKIAVRTSAGYAADDPGRLRRIVFCCFSEDSAVHHRKAMAALARA